MRTRGSLVIGLVALGGLALALARPPGDVEPAQPAPTGSIQLPDAFTTADVRLFVTGDTRGFIKPCGCSERLFGGVARRASKLASVRGKADLLVDLGNLVVGTRPHERLKLRYMLRALREMNYDLLVPGQGELLFGEHFEELLAEENGPRTICANLVYADTRESVFDPLAVLRPDGAASVAIIGLTSPSQRVADRYAVLPFEQVLPALVEKARGLADRVVIAGYIKGGPALELARKHPSVDFVVGSFVPSGSKELIRRGGAPVMLGGDRGRYLFRVEASAHTASRGGQVWLGEDIVDDPELAELVARHDAAASGYGPGHKERVQTLYGERGRSPSSACAECHADEYDTWRASKHAHAMEALEMKRSANDPSCLGCHYQDTARSNAAAVLGVGCAACHSGTAEHIQAMRGGAASAAAPVRTSQGMACTACHDPANSPQFDFEAYWKRIAHGRAQKERESR